MKIFSPHRRKLEARRRYGGKEFQNKIKKAQGYKRVFDPRNSGWVKKTMHAWRLDSRLTQLLLVGLFAASGYFLAISPYFLVTEFEIAGNEQIPAAQISQALEDSGQKRWLLIPKNHLFLLSKNQAQSILAERIPLVKEITRYRRGWPNRAAIEIVERRPGFVFNASARNFLIDDEGVVVKELDDISGLPYVTDQVSESVQVGEQLNNTKLVGFVLSLTKSWPGKINSQIKEIKVPGKAATQVQAVSSEGWGVFFDINRAADSQLANLALILNRQIPAQNRLNLAYIDLRFDKWAYYCYKNSPCEAQPQEPGAEQEQGQRVEVN